jgi:hypothetical protein
MFAPHLPGLLRDVLEDALTERTGEWLLFETGKLAAELDALNQPWHGRPFSASIAIINQA